MNSKLYGNDYNIPQEILAKINAVLIQYPNSEGTKRAKNLLTSKAVTYQSLKRLKNFFDYYNPQTVPIEQYELAGGDKMKGWVETVLNAEREGVKRNADTTSDMHVNNQANKLSNPNPLQNEVLNQRGDIMTENKDKINESPDAVRKDNISFANWNEMNAYPFGMDGHTHKIFIGEAGSIHTEIKGNGGEQYLDFIYDGRIWIIKKIISFWEYPPKNKFENFILDLQEAFNKEYNENIDIWDEFKIETRIKKYSVTKDWNGEYILLSLPDFFKNYDISISSKQSEQRPQHIQSPIDKKSIEVPQGLGSKKYGKELPIDVRQKLQTSESVSEDYTIVNNKNIKDNISNNGLVMNEEMVLSDRDFGIFVNAILNPRKPSENLVKAVENYKKILHEDYTIVNDKNVDAVKDNFTPPHENDKNLNVCAIAVIFNNEHKILLLKRSSRIDWEPNKWSFVGGTVENSETPIEAIKRETKEETGLDINTFIEKFSIKRENLIEYCFVAKYTGDDNDIDLNEENVAYLWADENQFKFLDTVPNFNEYLKLIFEEY